MVICWRERGRVRQPPSVGVAQGRRREMNPSSCPPVSSIDDSRNRSFGVRTVRVAEESITIIMLLVDEVLQDLCLLKVNIVDVIASKPIRTVPYRGNQVGNVFLKGISGGQKRRTSIGVELVVQRKILFLGKHVT